jgi:hypothetical protein
VNNVTDNQSFIGDSTMPRKSKSFKASPKKAPTWEGRYRAPIADYLKLTSKCVQLPPAQQAIILMQEEVKKIGIAITNFSLLFEAHHIVNKTIVSRVQCLADHLADELFDFALSMPPKDELDIKREWIERLWEDDTRVKSFEHILV